jgi:hypothetical protein
MEQRERQELYFGKFGTLEGIVLVLLILVSCISIQGWSFWHQTGLFSKPNYGLLILGFILGSLWTIFGSIKRVGRLPLDFILFFIFGTILTYYCFRYTLPWYLSFLVITFYSSDYILKCMHSHLIGTASKSPDTIIIVILIGSLFLDYFHNDLMYLEGMYWIYSLFMMFMVTFRTQITWSEMKECWVWWNKPKVEI